MFGLVAFCFGAELLFFVLVVSLLAEAGLSHRRASNFLVRDKKVTKEARLPTASGGTRYALAALRSNNRRKYEGLQRTVRDACARTGAVVSLCLVEK